MMAWVFAGCGLVPEKVLLSDPRIAPMLKAMEGADRQGLGFSPVTTNAQIRLEMASGRAYDAMLHVSGETSRATIAFRQTPSGYRRISEQATHDGPEWYQTADGTFREHIVVEYQTEAVIGIPTNQLCINYTGSNTNLAGHQLTLEEIRPILAEWEKTPAKPKPANLPSEGFDPGFALFVLFTVLALIAAGCLGLAIASVCLGLTAVFVAVGIISTSVLLAFLKRSISTGFRALFLQLGALAGLLGGAMATVGITLLTKGAWNSPLRWIVGLGIGLVAGVIFAWLFNKAWSFVARLLTTRLESTDNPKGIE